MHRYHIGGGVKEVLWYFLSRKYEKLIIIELEDSHKSFGCDLNSTKTTHLLFTFFLLFEKLLLSGNVTAVALGKNVLSHSLDCFACDDLAADSRLNGYLDQGARYVLLQLFRNAACSCIRLFLVDDEGKCVNGVAVEKEIKLDEL